MKNHNHVLIVWLHRVFELLIITDFYGAQNEYFIAFDLDFCGCAR